MISVISPVIGDIRNTNWNTCCDAQKRKNRILFVSSSQDIFVIYLLYWFPVALGRNESPVLGSSIVLIKKISCRNTFSISEAVSFILNIWLWHNLLVVEQLFSTTFEFICFGFDQLANKGTHVILWTVYFACSPVDMIWKKNPACILNHWCSFCSGEMLNCLDVSQAFDTVWHAGFLAMVMELGVEGIGLNW